MSCQGFLKLIRGRYHSSVHSHVVGGVGIYSRGQAASLDDLDYAPEFLPGWGGDSS